MRRFSYILTLVAAVLLLGGCTDRPSDFLFKDFFVSLSSEAGAATSTVLSTSNNFVVQYPVKLVSETRTEDLVVNIEVTPGDGLKEGTDYALPARMSLTFAPGEYLKYFRINYLAHPLDPSKDNSLRIDIVSTSDPSIIIGYPGPSKRFSSHRVTKVND